MNLEKTITSDYTLLKVLNDRLDTSNAPDLKSELVMITANGENHIILDVSNCSFCDSSGLSAILVANRLCKSATGIFILTRLQPDVERIIRISMLHTVLFITKTVEDAVELLFEKENI